MIVLDTNVVSELLRGSKADLGVKRWVRRLNDHPVTTVLNRAELLAGVAILPPGRRRQALADGIERILGDLDTCLPFTPDCPVVYAEVVAARRAGGRPIGAFDALIAAVALVHGASVATRDVDGFAGIGLTVVDPWSARP
ncbi:MAG: type II toxin-antitoxin system VapC family toxin [Dermatophilaceae bacterium]